jgi:hypothetical protein
VILVTGLRNYKHLPYLMWMPKGYTAMKTDLESYGALQYNLFRVCSTNWYSTRRWIPENVADGTGDNEPGHQENN